MCRDQEIDCLLISLIRQDKNNEGGQERTVTKRTSVVKGQMLACQ
jgi:hypothetical protein